MFGLGYAQPTVDREYERLEHNAHAASHAHIAEETPGALICNGRPHVVMMCSPADVEAFALGFSLTEVIVRLPGEIGKIDVRPPQSGHRVAIDTSRVRAQALEDRGRSLVGRTGCGLCGVTTVDDRRGTAVRGKLGCRDNRADRTGALWRAAALQPAAQSY